MILYTRSQDEDEDTRSFGAGALAFGTEDGERFVQLLYFIRFSSKDEASEAEESDES